ncbi:MAG: glycosyltransferase family 2 protein [Clostridia bacterium]
MNDIISVIVPVYKVEQYLEKCINSIINQTYINLEILLIDDGSPDKSPKICDEYASKDNRIKVIHKKNGGLSDARNKGLDIARGSYIVFVDSDDFIHHKMIQVLYDSIQKDKSDIAICGITYVNETYIEDGMSFDFCENKIVNKSDFWINFYDENTMAKVVAWNKLYKKEIFRNLRYDFGKMHEDEFILHKIIEESNQISFVSGKFYYYLQRSNSIMGQKFSIRRLDSIEGLLARVNYLIDNNYIKTAKIAYFSTLYVLMQGKMKLDLKNKLNKDQWKVYAQLCKCLYHRKLKKHFALTDKFKYYLVMNNPKMFFKLSSIKMKLKSSLKNS